MIQVTAAVDSAINSGAEKNGAQAASDSGFVYIYHGMLPSITIRVAAIAECDFDLTLAFIDLG